MSRPPDQVGTSSGRRYKCHYVSRTKLGSDGDWRLSGEVLDLAALTEAVTYHALRNQEKDECQADDQQALSNSEPG